jgi:AhpD family alkylhydroperoxidase
MSQLASSGHAARPGLASQPGLATQPGLAGQPDLASQPGLASQPDLAGPFTEHTIESAPAAARRFLTATRDHLGYLPAGLARMAASPQLIDGFMKLTAIFDSSALDPVAREVVIMTVATRNGCHICVAMHTARLAALGASADLIAALRDADPLEPLKDERLDAVRVFTLRVLHTAGDVGDQALRDFLGHGYTTQNALEVVLGIGTYTMSTLANRLTGAPVDDQLAAYA